ncbi:MAG TPA: tripartite tricarboxylate transporter permease [Anaerovoracaceae bacterium]|nr:tripartite tricarboxylate transporter permease [Anaerovoracaceae bacterium]
MSSIELLLNGFSTAAVGWNLLYCFIGVTVGMFIGVMPGLGPTAGTAMLIPVTFGMDPISAIIMLAGIYYGAMYGGTVTSVLINTPGEAASVITCLDGYEMTKQGRAGVALGVSAIGSFIGGTFSVIALTFLAPFISNIALKFGPPEFFCLLFLGLTMLLGLMGNSVLKGLMAAMFGFLISFVGLDVVTGEVRFDFEMLYLLRGIDLVPLVMGLFGISEIIYCLTNKTEQQDEKLAEIKKLLPEKHEWKPVGKSIGRGTIIGFFIGIIPGALAVIASIASYTVEKKTAKDPTRFGRGAIEGVAGPETANNACAGSSMIPLFTLGIPTSPTVAVLFGALMIHGLAPGPMLFKNESTLVWAVIASMFIGNAMLLIMNLPMARFWAKVALVPYKVLYPAIVVFCVVGAYSINYRVWDVGMMMIFGVIGYFMKRLDIPMAPAVLTFVLGDQIERALSQSLTMSHGSMLIFVRSPICIVILAVIAAIIAFSAYSRLSKRGLIIEDAEI